MLTESYNSYLPSMYADCFMISQGQTTADTESLRIQEQERLSPSEITRSSRWRSDVQTNPRLMGAELTVDAHKKNKTIKFQLNNKNIDVVLLPPTVAAIQTCFDIFGQREGIDIHIEPLLHPRINCAANIPATNLQQLFKNFTKSPYTAKIQQNPNWFMELGANQWNAQSSTGAPQQYCLDVIQRTGDFETLDRFLERTLKLRKELFEYVRTKKVVLITDPQVLEALTATGWHEDGKLINNVRFDYGQLKRQHVWIEGVAVEQEEKGLPFCSCG